MSLSVSYDPSTTALLPDYLDNTRVEEQEKTVAGMWAACITLTSEICKIHHIQDYPYGRDGHREDYRSPGRKVSDR